MKCMTMAAVSPIRKKSPQKYTKKVNKNCTSHDGSTHMKDENCRVSSGNCRESPLGQCNTNDDDHECRNTKCVGTHHHNTKIMDNTNENVTNRDVPSFDHHNANLLTIDKCNDCHCQLKYENPIAPPSDATHPQVLRINCGHCKKPAENERESNCSMTVKVTASNENDPLCAGTVLSTTTISSSSIATQTNSSATASISVTATATNSSSNCLCAICKKHDTSGHDDLRLCWNELKTAVLRIYRDSGLVLSQTFLKENRIDQLSSHTNKCPLPTNERLKEIVHRLCIHDRHKLYQCLEAQVRLFVVEMRLNLLKHLEHGSQALFEAMTDQYNKLCRASKKSAQFLQELESKHLRKFNLTWEFLNRRLFQSTVYCDPFIKHGLPKLTALTKDRSLIDMYARFLKFEDEMTVISVVWREAQTFIEKYEKYTVLNKKRSPRKECEQFSVEWVLEDHMSGTGKASIGDPSVCIKKPSIECLNARFLEEQKMLKSSKNMQSVNIAMETQSALDEQRRLALSGEWDSIDFHKTIATITSPTKSKTLPSPTTTHVDTLPLNKCDANEHHNDDDDCDDGDDDGDDDDDDDEDDDEYADDEEDDDDDSCSDHSSTTSTSTSNNQRGDGGRVCDCCYCEVFGHGMPAVAPTSRNFNEMRERLRMRLSKRKAEKCERITNANVQENPTKGNGTEDKRDLEELISFINGTDNNAKDKKKKEKQKKKKEKKQNENKKDKEKDSKTLSNNNFTPLKSLETKDEKQKDMKNMNGINNGINNESDMKEVHSKNNETDKSNSTNGINGNGHGKHSKSNGNGNSNGKKKMKTNGEKRDDVSSTHSHHNHNQHQQPQQQNHHYTAAVNHKTNDHSQSVCNGNDHIPNHKTNGNVHVQKQLSLSPDRINHESVKPAKGKQIKNQKNRKKNNTTEGLSPDDVFMPKDIDLDDGELDDIEKELEAFKRFCFNSVPLARKEKVNVNLKDIIIKKRND